MIPMLMRYDDHIDLIDSNVQASDVMKQNTGLRARVEQNGSFHTLDEAGESPIRRRPPGIDIVVVQDCETQRGFLIKRWPLLRLRNVVVRRSVTHGYDNGVQHCPYQTFCRWKVYDAPFLPLSYP